MSEEEIDSIEFNDEIDYYKTIDSKKLIIKHDSWDRIFSYFFLAIMITCGAFFTIMISKFQLQSSSLEISDYIISFLTTIAFIILSFYGIKTILGRNKLRVINYGSNQESKKAIINASINLKWSPYLRTDNYIRIRTKFSFTKDIQTITIVFFPDGKIYFNSVHFPNDYVKPARFDSNYQLLVEELKKIKTIPFNSDITGSQF
jgi:hypothetical protein